MRKFIICILIFLCGLFAGDIYFDNPVDDSQTVNVSDNTNSQSVSTFDNYVKPTDYIEPVDEAKEVVADEREKVMTSDGEIYGTILKFPGGGDGDIRVDTDGDGYPDYYRDKSAGSKSYFEDKGLLDVYEKYGGSMIIEKFNTNGKSARADADYMIGEDGAGYDNVKVFINGERDKNNVYIPGSGVLVYDGGIQEGASGALSYINMCTIAKKDKNIDKEWYQPFLSNCQKWL